MFINMVPDHDLCELKPNSGALHGTRPTPRKDISSEPAQ
jgi:hypothetical protein